MSEKASNDDGAGCIFIIALAFSALGISQFYGVGWGFIAFGLPLLLVALFA